MSVATYVRRISIPILVLATTPLVSSYAQPVQESRSERARPTDVRSRIYALVDSIVLPTTEGMDFLTIDARARRLYVARWSAVDVIDLDRRIVTGHLSPAPGVHEVALAKSLGRIFATDAADTSIGVFDEHTLAAVGRTKATGIEPDAIVFDRRSRRVFAFNGLSGDATILDARSGRVVKHLPLGGYAETPVADGTGNIYVGLKDHGEVLRIDSRRAVITARWKVQGCAEPHGLLLDPSGRRLIIGCADSLFVVSRASGRREQAIHIFGVPDELALDPTTGTVFAAAGRATRDSLFVVHRSRDGGYDVMSRVALGPWGNKAAFDPATGTVYVSELRRLPRDTTSRDSVAHFSARLRLFRAQD